MARIELRNVTGYVQDGLSGTAVIEETTPGATDTEANVNTVNLNTTNTASIPVGARFTVNTANNTTTYTVTARDPSSGNTNSVNFSPAWGANTPATGDVMTFISQRVEIKFGDGNVTWTEAQEFEYQLDRGTLDQVKEGDDQPLEVSFEFAYEYLKSSSGGAITIRDALDQTGEAAEWVSTSSDLCEPYCVDIRLLNCVPCGTDEDEDVLFEEFRWDTRDFSVGDATVAITGRCNKRIATITRSNNAECA